MLRARDISFIRKLCGLGLPAETVAQSLLPELRKLIPSHSAGVFWVDEQGEMASLYAERLLPPEAMAAYYAKHYTVNVESFSDVFRRRAQNDDPISTHSFSQAEQSTDYFRDIMQRLDAYHVLYGVLKEGDRPLGQISFYRGVADSPFDRESGETLRAVIRYLAAGLAARGSRSHPDDEAVVMEEEVGIVSLDGATISASEGWSRLLRLAALAHVSPRDALKERDAITLFVRHVCESMTLPQKAASTQREFVYPTAWGRFVIRAFRLSDPSAGAADRLGLLIRRSEPRSLSLVRGTGAAALSSQQREVALLIAAGKSNREIADELGLSFNTASSHVKQVYARLEVNERAAVGQKLLHLAQSAAAH